MMKEPLLRLAFAAVAALLLVSCSRPSSDEMFVRKSETDAYGRYDFKVAMDEEDKAYDMDLMVLIDSDNKEIQDFDGLTLFMLWVSPTDRKYEEVVRLGGNTVTETNGWSSWFGCPYRANTVPTELGEWSLDITVADTCAFADKVAGLGLKLIRKDNGTRETEEVR